MGRRRTVDRSRWLGWLVGAALALLASPAFGQDVPYEVRVSGVSGELKDTVEAASRLLTLKDKPPPSLVALHRRVDDDRDRIAEVLRNFAFYGASLVVSVDDSVRPVQVEVTIDPGPPFTLASFRVVTAGVPPPEIPIAELGIDLGATARAAAIVAAGDKLLSGLAERGHPLARVVERHVVVDHATHSVAVQEDVDAGPAARFGAAAVTGLQRLDPRWVRNRISWREGQDFDSRLVERTRQRLQKSGLFSRVAIDLGHAVDENGALPLTVALTERKDRSVGGGVSYSTTEGPGVQALWEDRNLADHAERVRVRGYYSSIREGAEANFRDPDRFGVDRDLVGDVKLETQHTQAFATRSAETSAGVEWQVSDHWWVSAAGDVERATETENLVAHSFLLVSVPMKVRRDTSDDLLDPAAGSRATVAVTPFLPALGSDLAFTRGEFGLSRYVELSTKPRVVVAGWGQVGSIFGSDTVDVPPSKRFYQGGGGSVRAYGHQLAGPVDANNTPVGGRSALALGAELRLRVTDDVGLVPFVEGGSVYPSQIPSPRHELFWGGGLGLRYFTPLGPVRADVAVPARRRPDVDAPFQIYLSLGQAF